MEMLGRRKERETESARKERWKEIKLNRESEEDEKRERNRESE